MTLTWKKLWIPHTLFFQLSGGMLNSEQEERGAEASTWGLLMSLLYASFNDNLKMVLA